MNPEFRIAVITTEYSPISHADVIVSRWLEPRPGDQPYGWGSPRSRIVSMFVDQCPENDLSVAACEKHGVRLCASVQDALEMGTGQLAVDGILLIAEHGNYPCNERGQKLYPRRELFEQVVAVFQSRGGVLPLFFDKHFSWDIPSIHTMYRTVRKLKIPIFGGSSLPHSPLSAPIAPGSGDAVGEIVLIYWNALEDYLFHSLELARSVLEKDRGVEVRLRSITAWKDGAVWDALDRGDFSPALFDEATRAVSPDALETMRRFRAERGTPVYAFQLLHDSGLKETHVMQKDLIRKWSLACRLEKSGRIDSAHVLAGGKAEFYPHFARFNRVIEDFFLTGKAPVAVERLYATSLATAACLHALDTPGVPCPAREIQVPDAGDFHSSLTSGN